MKKIVIFILILLSALTSFAQYSDYYSSKPKDNPTEYAGCGVGLDYDGNKYSVILSCNIYHWEVMYRGGLDDTKAKGPIGQHYSSVMSTYSCMSYLGSYRGVMLTSGIYIGYIIKHISLGTYFGYEEYDTGETYGNLNHVSNWDAVFSVHNVAHTRFVYGAYIKYYLDKRMSLFCSYKFNTEANAFSFGMVFDFMTYHK